MAAALALQSVAWWLLVHTFKTRRTWYGFFDVTDIGLYESYARQFAAGLQPYRPVAFEYPPLAAPLMSLPRALGSWLAYDVAFATVMGGLCALAAALATATAARLTRGYVRPLIPAIAFALVTLLAGAITANRFDVAVAFDMALAAYCMSRRAWWLAGACLGAGFALKLTPALLLPPLLIFAPKLRQAVAALVAFGMAAALPFLPHILRGGKAILYVFSYHGERPLQIESLYATGFLLWHLAADGRVSIGNSHGSQSLIAPGAESLASASMWVMLSCLAAFYLLLWLRREPLRRAPWEFSLAALGVLLIFACTSKVLSPQFMIWFFPWTALACAAARPGTCIVGVLLLVATGLTQLLFPARYWDLVALQRWPILIISARNITLLAGGIVVAILIWKRRRPA